MRARHAGDVTTPSSRHGRNAILAAVVGAALAVSSLGVLPQGARAADATTAAVTSGPLDATESVHGLVTSVASNQPNNGSGSSESVSNLRDRDAATKWYEGSGGTPSGDNPIYAIYALSAPAAAASYTITSANDSPERDPSSWTLLGTNDATTAADANATGWEELDAQSGQVFSQRHEKLAFGIADPGAFRYYQLRVTGNRGGASSVQLSDWTLLGALDTSDEVLGAGSSWQYWDATTAGDATTDPAAGSSDRTSWTRPGADTSDARWRTAAAPFGVKKQADGSDGPDLGDGFTATTLLRRDGGAAGIAPAYFFRHTVDLTAKDLGRIGGMLGQVVFDDTATVYVNGTRVAGWNDDAVTANTTPLDYGGQSDPQRQVFTVPADLLREGENVIAVEVHQCNGTSSDAWFDAPTLVPTSDYVSLGYTDEERQASYTSNTWPATSDGSLYFTTLLAGFDDLKERPDLLGANTVVPNGQAVTALDDEKIIEINNGASAKQVARAINDANNSPVDTMYDGFGERLGKLYLAAKAAGELPKTNEVLGLVTNGIDQHDAAKGVYSYMRPYQRLGFVKNGGRLLSGDIGYGFANDSFPSGHTTGGYVAGTTLATLLSELGPQILQRASEYGNNRIVLGFHYPTDIMGGRIGGQAMIGYRWDDPKFRGLLEQAHDEMETVLLQKCREAGYGDTITQCASDATSTTSAVGEYHQRLTYGFPAVQATGAPLTIPTGAEDLLITRFPNLTDAQRREVIRQTALDSGYPMDRSNEGEASWERIDLAAALAAKVTVLDDDGGVKVEKVVDPATLSSDASLAGVTVGGTALPGFRAGARAYVVQLPATATEAPQVAARATGAGARVTVRQATSPTGTATITVTAANGSTSTTTVTFVRARPGTPAVALATLAKPGVYGSKRVAVVVKTASSDRAARSGRATVALGGKAVAHATVTNGTGTVLLPRALAAGRRAVSVTFRSNAGASVTARTTVTVAKAKVTLRPRAKHARKSTTITVRLTGRGATAPTGKVLATVSGRIVGKGSVHRVHGLPVAVLHVKSTKASRRGKLAVRYRGDHDHRSSVRHTTIRVR